MDNGERKEQEAGKDTPQQRRLCPTRHRDCRCGRCGNRTLARRYRGSHDHQGCTDWEVRKGQVTVGSVLEKVIIEIWVIGVVEEGGHLIFLVEGAFKDV